MTRRRAGAFFAGELAIQRLRSFVCEATAGRGVYESIGLSPRCIRHGTLQKVTRVGMGGHQYVAGHAVDLRNRLAKLFDALRVGRIVGVSIGAIGQGRKAIGVDHVQAFPLHDRQVQLMPPGVFRSGARLDPDRRRARDCGRNGPASTGEISGCRRIEGPPIIAS